MGAPAIIRVRGNRRQRVTAVGTRTAAGELVAVHLEIRELRTCSNSTYVCACPTCEAAKRRALAAQQCQLESAFIRCFADEPKRFIVDRDGNAVSVEWLMHAA